jgi:hypothetical protein
MKQILENLVHNRFRDSNHIIGYLSIKLDDKFEIQENEFDTPENIDDSFDLAIGNEIYSLFYIIDKRGYYYITEVSKQV